LDRYETDRLKFFETRNGHWNGSNNIVDMWKEYNLGMYLYHNYFLTDRPLHLETAEEVDSLEALDFDDEQYQQLLDNVLDLRLYHQKAVLRQFMAAARGMYCHSHILYSISKLYRTEYYKLTGRILWLDIAENPLNHLTKRS
jgi:hypothetical protein